MRDGPETRGPPNDSCKLAIGLGVVTLGGNSRTLSAMKLSSDFHLTKKGYMSKSV